MLHYTVVVVPPPPSGRSGKPPSITLATPANAAPEWGYRYQPKTYCTYRKARKQEVIPLRFIPGGWSLIAPFISLRAAKGHRSTPVSTR